MRPAPAGGGGGRIELVDRGEEQDDAEQDRDRPNRSDVELQDRQRQQGPGDTCDKEKPPRRICPILGGTTVTFCRDGHGSFPSCGGMPGMDWGDYGRSSVTPRPCLL